jgi:hypothetical protein
MTDSVRPLIAALPKAPTGVRPNSVARIRRSLSDAARQAPGTPFFSTAASPDFGDSADQISCGGASSISMGRQVLTGSGDRPAA